MIRRLPSVVLALCLAAVLAAAATGGGDGHFAKHVTEWYPHCFESVPALQAVDLSLGTGKVGVGSFDETGEFKNIRITTTESGSVQR